jgi:hypothetical protein
MHVNMQYTWHLWSCRTSTLAVDDGMAMRIGRTRGLCHAQYGATVLPYTGIKLASIVLAQCRCPNRWRLCHV